MDYKLPENRTWPKDGLEKTACYPICRGGERKLLYDELTDKTFLRAWPMVTISMLLLRDRLPRPQTNAGNFSYGL